MGSIKRWLGYLLLVVVLVFGVFFSLQNTARVPLDLLLVQLSEQSVALWVLLAFATGGVTGILVSGVALLRLKGRNAILQRRLDRQNTTLNQPKIQDSSSSLPNTTSNRN